MQSFLHCLFHPSLTLNTLFYNCSNTTVFHVSWKTRRIKQIWALGTEPDTLSSVPRTYTRGFSLTSTLMLW